MYLHQGQGDAGDGGVHELLQVLVKELEDEVELIFRVDDVQQPRVGGGGGGGDGGRQVSTAFHLGVTPGAGWKQRRTYLTMLG